MYLSSIFPHTFSHSLFGGFWTTTHDTPLSALCTHHTHPCTHLPFTYLVHCISLSLLSLSRSRRGTHLSLGRGTHVTTALLPLSYCPLLGCLFAASRPCTTCLAHNSLPGCLHTGRTLSLSHHTSFFIYWWIAHASWFWDRFSLTGCRLLPHLSPAHYTTGAAFPLTTCSTLPHCSLPPVYLGDSLGLSQFTLYTVASCIYLSLLCTALSIVWIFL